MTHTTDLTPLFNTFAKGTPRNKAIPNTCVIYTRVSSKEQESGYSLQYQARETRELAERRNLTILASFGGKFESATKDERVEFSKMLEFIRTSKIKVGYIVVHAADRFSRTGGNALFLKEKLKEQGVYILSVMFGTDSTTVEGDCNQNDQLVRAHNDNQLRRARCMKGTRDMLLSGQWPTMPPIGYEIARSRGKREIVVNETGRIIAQAFVWKSEGASNEDIRKRLADRGVKLCFQRVSSVLKNPFYCGILVHSTLEGMTVEGTHEKIVSKELFLRINGLMKEKQKHGYAQRIENELVPLKHFLRCNACNKPLTAYEVPKKGLWYYKCLTKHCCNNKSAKELNARFAAILEHFTFTITPELANLIKIQMTATFNQLTGDVQDSTPLLKKQLQEVTRKLERTEERFMEEEISAELYQKYSQKYASEKSEIEQKLAATTSTISNLDVCIDKAIDYASNLASRWSSAGYTTRQALQYLLFPQGMTYDKQKDIYLTGRFNSVFASIAYQLRGEEHKKRGVPYLEIQHSSAVVSTGIEPVSNV